MNEKCIVKGCLNKKSEGLFKGDLCNPCYQDLTSNNIFANRKSAVYEKVISDLTIFSANTTYFVKIPLFNIVKSFLKKTENK